MKYQEYQAGKEATKFVRNYWRFDIVENEQHQFPFLHESMPENTLSLVLIKRGPYMGVRFMGPQLQKFQQEIYTDSVFLGIRLHPWIYSKALCADKEKLINQTADIPEALIPFFQTILQSGLYPDFSRIDELEAACLKLFEQIDYECNELIKYICLQLEKGVKIKELVEEIPLSVRPIQKLFKSRVGISMKQYQHISNSGRRP